MSNKKLLVYMKIYLDKSLQLIYNFQIRFN